MHKLSVPEWCCAIRFNDSNETYILNDKSSKFIVLKDTYRYWTADPFLFKYKSEYYLFFEMFDRLKRKGLLGCRKISKDCIGDLQVIFECDYHLSYPFIFEENGEIYIIPECEKSGELFRLKCIDFPTKWVKEKVLFKERLADTTPLKVNDKIFYITEKIDDTHTFDRLDLLYEENDEIKECKSNPVKKDVKTARCAGKVFKYYQDLIRPSQDCGETYGKNLNFNKIINISKNNYEEELLTTISVDEINVDNKSKYVGIHTYNKLDNIEVVDLKIGANFNFLNIIGGMLKRLRLFLR